MPNFSFPALFRSRTSSGKTEGTVELDDPLLASVDFDSVNEKLARILFVSMLDSSYFSISCFKKAAEKIHGQDMNIVHILGRDLRDALSALHCVDYYRMDGELLNVIAVCIAKTFNERWAREFVERKQRRNLR